MVVDHHNHFALALIAQDLQSAVDLGMLIDQAVAGVVPDKFDRCFEPFSATDAVGFVGHFLSTPDGIGPEKHGDAGLHRVAQLWEVSKRHIVAIFSSPGATTGNTYVASHDR